jgi:phospholipid transport system transporter-binding protein
MPVWPLPAQVDLEHANDLLAQLQTHVEEVQAGAELVLDVSALRAFDSSTLALMLEARRRLQAVGGTLRIDAAPPKLVELARLYGLESLLLGVA